MYHTPLSWDHCRSFLSVCRTGSLSAAARASGLTQPTIARHVAQLEDALGGGALFIRSPQGLAPTDRADALLPHALAMEASAAAMLRAASGNTDEIAGTVRITASVVIGVEVLPAILAGISADYPDLTFEVVPSNQTADLLRRDADIAVRLVRPNQGALVAQSVGDIMLGMFAQEAYLARRGTPQQLEDLAGHAVIGIDRDTALLQSVSALGFRLSREMFAFRSDSDLAQLAAIRSGFGIGICQTALARRSPGMVHLFPQKMAFALGTWITMHEDLRGNRRMRVVFDRLVSAMSAYARETQAA